MQKCIGPDGKEYLEINGTWYFVEPNTGRLERTSRPTEGCTDFSVFTKDKESEFFTKHLIKKKGEK